MIPFTIAVDDQTEADILEDALRYWVGMIGKKALPEARDPVEFDDMVTYEEAGQRLWKKLMEAIK